MCDASLEEVLVEKYHLYDELQVDGMFVRLSGNNHKTALCLVAVALTERSLVIAKPDLRNSPCDYELVSVTPLSLITVAIQSFKEKVLSVRSKYKPMQVLQMCSCDDQDKLWLKFVDSIETFHTKRKHSDTSSTPHPTIEQREKNNSTPSTLNAPRLAQQYFGFGDGLQATRTYVCLFTNAPHERDMPSNVPSFISQTRSLTDVRPKSTIKPDVIGRSFSAPVIPEVQPNSSEFAPLSCPNEFKTFNKKYSMRLFERFESTPIDRKAIKGAVQCYCQNNSHIRSSSSLSDIQSEKVSIISSFETTDDSSLARSVTIETEFSPEWSVSNVLSCCLRKHN